VPLFAPLLQSALIASLKLDVVFAIQALPPSARAMLPADLAPGIIPPLSVLPSPNAKLVLTVPLALASKGAVGATSTDKVALALSRRIAVLLELGTLYAQCPCAVRLLTARPALPPMLLPPLRTSVFGARATPLPPARIPKSAKSQVMQSLTVLSPILAFLRALVTHARPPMVASGAKVLLPRRVSEIPLIAPARLLQQLALPLILAFRRPHVLHASVLPTPQVERALTVSLSLALLPAPLSLARKGLP